MEENSPYAGRRVVITGVSSGVGAATAKRAKSMGAEVIGLDLKEPETDIDRFVPLDLRSEDSIQAAATAVPEGIDALFQCAGVSAGAGLPMHEVFTINFTGTRALAESLIPKVNDGGTLAFISSLAALKYRDHREISEQVLPLDWRQVADWLNEHPDAIAPNRAYAFSKEAVIWYVLSLVARLSPHRIRVNCIAPGPTDTPFLASTLAREESRRQLETIPQLLGRRATAQEQAEVLLFLNSSAAAIVNGQVIWTDGGYRGAVAAGGVQPAMGEEKNYV